MTGRSRAPGRWDSGHIMQHLNDHFLFSPSDLGSFLACEHLTQLELAVALREGRRPSYENSYAELLRRKGQEHEQAFLATLHDAGRTVVEVRDFEDPGVPATRKTFPAGSVAISGTPPPE